MSTTINRAGHAAHASRTTASFSHLVGAATAASMQASRPPRRIGAVLAHATETLLRLEKEKR